MASYTVVYDACVLYPAPLRDFLIELAAGGLFRAKWTDEIHEEWIGNLLANRSDLDRGKLETTRRLMDRAVIDCLVSGYYHLIPSIQCPDPDDRHVIAAAIHARADAIVTFNLKDFPSSALAPYNLEAIHPDEFVTLQADLNLAAVLTAAQHCRRRLRNPPKSVDEFLSTLNAQALTKTVALLRQYGTIL